MFKKILLSFSDWTEKEYFTLSSWYIISFILGIIIAFTYGLNNYYCPVAFISVLVLVLIKFAKDSILLKFIFNVIIFCFIGIILTIFRKNIVEHQTIATSHIAQIKGKIELIRPYFNGLQALIKVESIEPGIDVEYVKINFLSKVIEKCFVGDTIIFNAILSPLSKKLVPNGFDFFFIITILELMLLVKI